MNQMPFLKEFLAFIVGIASGFLGSTVGSGGMIALPFLLSLGLPPQVAVGTTKLGDVGTFILALRNYHRSKIYDKKLTLGLSIVAGIAALFGAFISIALPEDILRPYIAIVILLFLPFILLGSNKGMVATRVSAFSWWTGVVGFFIVSLNASIVPAGGATISLLLLVYCLGLEFVRAYGTLLLPAFIRTVVSASIFVLNGLFDPFLALILFIGGAIGGHFGSNAAVLKGNKWLKALFILVVIASTLKVLLT